MLPRLVFCKLIVQGSVRELRHRRAALRFLSGREAKSSVSSTRAPKRLLQLSQSVASELFGQLVSSHPSPQTRPRISLVHSTHYPVTRSTFHSFSCTGFSNYPRSLASEYAIALRFTARSVYPMVTSQLRCQARPDLALVLPVQPRASRRQMRSPTRKSGHLRKLSLPIAL